MKTHVRREEKLEKNVKQTHLGIKPAEKKPSFIDSWKRRKKS